MNIWNYLLTLLAGINFGLLINNIIVVIKINREIKELNNINEEIEEIINNDTN